MEKKSSWEFMDSDQMDLKHLTICHHESDHTQVVTSSMLSRTSSSSSSAIGDYIGTESCFDVLSVDDMNDAFFAEPDRSIPPPCRRKEAKAAAAAREFPPPIPRLARTENLPSHMPWVLTRVYTSDGRLILREEKVRHHEYFRAHRSNGRLTLQLVPLDDDDVFDHDDDDDDHHHPHDVAHDGEHDEEDVVLDDHEARPEGDDEIDAIVSDHDVHDDVHDDDDDVLGDVNGNVDDGGDEGGQEACPGDGGDDDHRGIMLSSVADQTVVEIAGGGGSPGGKCLKSCFLGMQVPEIRPVLS